MALRLGIPKKYRGLLRLGTTSWKYDTWKGLIYERGKTYRPDDYLADYAKHLDSVEVDQWFYSLFPGGLRLPDPTAVEFYAKSVPDDFVFTVKAPNSLTLTHYYSKQTRRYADFAGKPNPAFLDRDLLRRFLDALSPLGSKLGPIMFQFEYLNKQKMPSVDAFIERFGEFIDRAPKGYRYALEVRNKNFYTPAFFGFLKSRGLGFVYVEVFYMPPIGEVFEKFMPETASFQVIRLHGGDRVDIESQTGEVWDKIVAPKPTSLKAAAEIVRANAKKKILTYLNLSNHYEGSAPLSLRRFLDVLGGKKIEEAPF
jgi:uncharacterized protein YecE (DUF72 family)